MPEPPHIVTVTLNPAMDCTLETPGLQLGDHARGKLLGEHPGGKGVNVSYALARLGRRSIVTGFVGEDERSAFDQHLTEAGEVRPVSQLLTLRGRTRRNFTFVDSQRSIDTHVTTEGFVVTPADVQRVRTKLRLLARPNRAIAICGSLPSGMTIDDLRSLMEVVIEGNAHLVIDAGGELLAQIVAAAAAWADGGRTPVMLLKPNADELAAAVGKPKSDDMKTLLAYGRELLAVSRWVVISRGKAGILVLHESGARSAMVDVDQAAVTNTVGCGDCLLAGLLGSGLMTQIDEPDMRLAIGAAGANATRLPGAAAGDFDAEVARAIAEAAVVESVVLESA